ncbi:MAG: serine/threonine protein kinase [Myxococcaceae bacterium]
MSGAYRLTGRIETGELAELFKAVRGREPVVIKLFHPRTSDAGYARDMAETARALNPLGHAGIVHVLELGLVRQRLAVVREDVGGFNLGQALQRLNTKEVLLQTPLALAMIIELADLVQRAHQAGVVHGAITPGNVLLSREGKLSVCDFGALKALNSVAALKKVFGARGRGAYRAPEVTQGEEPTQASDLYSLGAIAYELLTLREPITGKGASMSTRHEPLPAPSRLDRRINSRLDPIVMRALDASPPRRFKSCGEFAQAIRGFIIAGGGMPARDEGRKFVSELFPNEVNLETLGPVPFAESFDLSEVRGADLVPVSDRSMVLMARPSFSGGEVPVVGADEQTSETVPGEDAGGPGADEGTAPGNAGPLESGWHAPPGAAPPKKVPLGSTPGAITGARLAMKRVRVIEDFQGMPEAPGTVETPAAPSPQAPEPRPASVPAVSPEVSGPISDPGFPLVMSDTGGKPRRMITEERSLYRVAQRRQKLMMVAGAIALVGAFSFALVVWRVSSKPPQKAVVTPPKPESTPPVPEVNERAARPIPHDPEPPPVEWHVPPKRGAGFLSLSTDTPATVFIDGQRVRKGTPLKRYPVAPGSTRITLVAGSTGARREFTLRVAKGQWVKLEERFGPAPGRR